MATDLVWQKDVEDQEEMALDCWKVTYKMYLDLIQQGAPQQLVNEMILISNHFGEAYKKLNAIKACFPDERVVR